MRSFVRVLVVSGLLSVVLVSLAEHVLMGVYSPVREMFVFDSNDRVKSENGSSDNSASHIPKEWMTRYPQGNFINPVHVAQRVRSDSLSILRNGVREATRPDEVVAVADVLAILGEAVSFEGLDGMVLAYEFFWDAYGLTPGWRSGMAQAHGIEVMLAAYKLTADDRYRQSAVALGNAMLIPVEEGGVAVQLEEGVWLEEYAQEGASPSFALNGHIFAVEGLMELAKVEGRFSDAVEDAVLATEFLLPEFNKVFWSHYDLQGQPANQKYHWVHIRQMKWLYEVTGTEVFRKYHRVFVSQQFVPVQALYRLVTNPNRFLVFLLLVHWVMFFAGVMAVVRLRGWSKRRISHG